MPGTDSNSGRCSLLYHSLNSGASLASISTYTMKIPRPFCAMFPSPLCSVAAIVWPRLLGTGPHAWEPREIKCAELRRHWAEIVALADVGAGAADDVVRRRSVELHLQHREMVQI